MTAGVRNALAAGPPRKQQFIGLLTKVDMHLIICACSTEKLLCFTQPLPSCDSGLYSPVVSYGYSQGEARLGI